MPANAPGQPSPGKRDDEGTDWYRLSGVGMEFVVAVLLFGFLGRWLDSHMGTSPWMTLLGFCIGFAVGLYMLIKAGRQMF